MPNEDVYYILYNVHCGIYSILFIHIIDMTTEGTGWGMIYDHNVQGWGTGKFLSSSGSGS